jgi:hydroxyethylthiazole kinase
MNKYADLLQNVRAVKPLVHHITNYVTVNDCANVTLAIGGSPVMATAIEEAGKIAALASAVVLNIGTLNAVVVPAMIAAGKSANKKGVPVVFDPVGAGASGFRSSVTARILANVGIAVVRGNISEIRAVGGMDAHTKGVDADNRDMGADPGRLAADLARERNFVVAVTGATDVVSDGKRTVLVENGHPMLADVSGTGCMCTSLAGAFLGVEPSRPVPAAAAALLCMGVAGEIAFGTAGSKGLGSYRQAVMDAISVMDAETVLAMGKIREA